MKYTEKLKLKKPELTDNVNIGDLNDNMDILDEEVGNLKEGSATIEELQTSNKTLAGAINELKDEVDSKESPSGAQAKANAVLNAAKQYTDEEVGKIADDLAAHKADYTSFKKHVEKELDNYNSFSSNKDDNGIYTVIKYKRPDDTLYMKSTLSNPDEDGNYQTMTWEFYDDTGEEVINIVTWTITYDEDGDIVSKVVSA